MRASVLLAAPLIAAAYGKTHTGSVYTVTGSTSTATVTYSNPATQYTTETNSNGVITGMPTNSGATAVVTTQPEVATIPAGEPKGIDTIFLNISKSLTSFEISVGKKTTVVLGGGAVATSASLTTGKHPGVGHQTAGSAGASGSASSSGSPSKTGSNSSSSSGAASSNMKVASAGVLGLGAFIAALL